MNYGYARWEFVRFGSFVVDGNNVYFYGSDRQAWLMNGGRDWPEVVHLSDFDMEREVFFITQDNTFWDNVSKKLQTMKKMYDDMK